MDNTSAPKRSQEFWFEDGDTVLIVVVDGTDYHFRVHRAILTIHSPVFRDMFSISQTSDGGTSTVPLKGDSVQDVTALLGELYCGRVAQIVTFDAALGILRLAHKYQCTGLQQRMKLKLLEDWPLNRSEYLARIAYKGSGEDRIQDALKLIETAQRCQVNELLPTAFYELACAWGTRWEEIAPHLSPANSMRLSVGRARCEGRLRSFGVWTEKIHESDSFSQSLDRKWYGTSDRTKTIECVKTIGSTFRTQVERLMFRGSFALFALGGFRREDLGNNVEKYWADWFMSLVEEKVRECWESIPTDFGVQATPTE